MLWFTLVRGGCSLLIGATFLLLGGLDSPTWAQTDAGPATLTPDQLSIINSIEESSGERKQFAAAPTEPVGARIKLPFGDGKHITLVRKASIRQNDGSVSWRGEVEETGEPAVLMLWNSALLTGYFAYNGTIFTVENPGGGINIFSEMDQRRLPPDHPPSTSPRDNAPIAPSNQAVAPRQAPTEPNVAPFPDAERKALEAKSITIDVMLLYTKNVTKRYVREPEDLLALAIEETNESFKNSGLGNIILRLVHTQLIDYDASNDDQFTHLYTMVDALGPFKDVKKLRNEKRADIVGLIIDNPNGCGLSTRVRPDSDDAYFVAHHACATITMSIAHEIGHILGVRHDRFVDETNTPFAYGHGYVSGTKWRDVMSYKEGCGGCPRIPFWSNPRVMHKGEPTGTVAADSARVVLELADHVSKFR
jgi:peptidyl-Asp metalloendopeptidase